MTARPLSVALLSHLASPGAPTGAERSLALLAAGLDRRGHRVVVVNPDRSPMTAMLEGTGVEAWTFPTRACWLTYHDPRPWPIVAGKWLRFRLGAGAARPLANRLREWKPDLCHVNCLPHLTGAHAARLSGAPVVWHLREILPPGSRRRWFARRLERDSDRIVAVSEAVASWVRAEGVGRPLDVIHNGIVPPGDPPSKERARGELGLETGGVLVGLFGQILPHKGVLDFVEAAAVTLRSHPDARFVIAGDGPESYVREVDRAIAATGRSTEIRRVPSRPDPSILFAAADVIALTTRTPDPLPRAVLEGLAAGRPVVAYRSGGVPEMVDEGETGLLVDTGDVAGLAHALTTLVADAARRDEMGRRAARSAIERFGVERHVDRMEQLFERLAGRERSGP